MIYVLSLFCGTPNLFEFKTSKSIVYPISYKFCKIVFIVSIVINVPPILMFIPINYTMNSGLLQARARSSEASTVVLFIQHLNDMRKGVVVVGADNMGRDR